MLLGITEGVDYTAVRAISGIIVVLHARGEVE